MGYLVYCPVCSNKISSAAITCPHCGEPQAHYVKEVVSRTKTRCRKCRGTGQGSDFIYANSTKAAYRDGKIYFPATFRKTGEVWDNCVCGGEPGWRDEGVWEEQSQYSEARKAFNSGDYRLENYVCTLNERLNIFCGAGGYLNVIMYWNRCRKPCLYCNGTGVMVSTQRDRIDSRKKVE